MGAGGKIFDWLRMLYERMNYTVRHNSEMFYSFKSGIGILIKDVESPVLWNLFLADFVLHPDTDDVVLAGSLITSLEQADDIISISKTPEGLQRMMNALGRWCSRNFMSINAIKSYVMVFGPLPFVVPNFSFDGTPVGVTHQQTYVGVSFTSTSRNIFDNHYNVKASKAWAVGNLIFGMESSVGILPPSEGKTLYMSLLDPHLTHGAEVCLDIDPKSIQPLEDVPFHMTSSGPE